MVATFRTDLVLVSMITPAHRQPAWGFLFIWYDKEITHHRPSNKHSKRPHQAIRRSNGVGSLRCHLFAPGHWKSVRAVQHQPNDNR